MIAKTLSLSSAVLIATPLLLIGAIWQGAQRTRGDFQSFISWCSQSWQSLLGFALHNKTIFIVALIALFGFSFIRGLVFFIRQIRATRKLQENLLQKRVDNLRLGTDKQVIVAVNDSKMYAITAGFVRPTIYLSTVLIKRLSEKELQSVIAHEQYHQQHSHPLILLLINTLQSYFFFVPLFKNIASYITLRNEYRADRESIKTTSHSSLASALLKTIEEENNPTFPVSVSAFAHTAQRVAYVINRNSDRPRFSLAWWSVVLSVGIVLFISYIFFTPQIGQAHQQADRIESSQFSPLSNVCHDLNYSSWLSFMDKNQSELNPAPEQSTVRDFAELRMTLKVE